MIISRYINKEIAAALVAITAILLLIFLSNQLVRYLGYVTDGRLPVASLFKLLLVEIPNLLGLLLPLGLYLASLFVYSRMAVDKELTVLSACGVSQWQLIKYILPLTLGMVVIVGSLSLWLNPKIMSYRNQLLEQSGMAATLQMVRPEQFEELNNGKRVIYIANISTNRQQMRGLFVAQQATVKSGTSEIPTWEVLTAEKGYQQVNKKTGEQFIVTANSHRYLGLPGNKDYQIMNYGKYGIRIKTAVAPLAHGEDALPTWMLWLAGTKHKLQAVELQWRLSPPLMTFLLAILAVPLGRLGRNQSRYARFFPALMIFIVYANMLFVARAWVKQGLIPVAVGLWWIHGIMLVGTLAILAISRVTVKPWWTRRAV